MSRDDVLRMAREAGLSVTPPRSGQYDGGRLGGDVVSLERFAALVAADARAARIAAQTENEALKARLAASGVAERRAVHEAVLAEREACAKVCADAAAQLPAKIDNQADFATLNTCINLSRAIRARGAA